MNVAVVNTGPRRQLAEPRPRRCSCDSVGQWRRRHHERRAQERQQHDSRCRRSRHRLPGRLEGQPQNRPVTVARRRRAGARLAVAARPPSAMLTRPPASPRLRQHRQRSPGQDQAAGGRPARPQRHTRRRRSATLRAAPAARWRARASDRRGRMTDDHHRLDAARCPFGGRERAQALVHDRDGEHQQRGRRDERDACDEHAPDARSVAARCRVPSQSSRSRQQVGRAQQI